MRNRIKYLDLRIGLLLSLLIACPVSTYAADDSSQSIIVNAGDNSGRTVKLRPFVRNRALPSRAEIAALQEERARMADEVRTFSPLNGKVSAFENYQSQNYESNLRTNNTRRRVNHFRKPNQPVVSQPAVLTEVAPAAPAPVAEPAPSLPAVEPVVKSAESNTQGFSFLHTAEQYFSGLFSHPPDTSASSQTKPAAPIQAGIVPPAGYPAFPSEQTTPSPINTLSLSPVMTAPSESSGFGSAGPPPFPLSLLPAPALKQLIRSMAYGSASHAGHAPPSYFGSWHNSSTFSMNSPGGSLANISPQGNFHSYLPLAYSHRASRSSSAPWAVTKSHRSSHSPRAAVKKDQTKLISYPAYNRQSVMGLNTAE